MEISLEKALVRMFFQRQREAKPSVSLLNEMKQQCLLRDVLSTFTQTGLPHQPHFVVECCVVTRAGRKWITTGEGKTKKAAAVQAATEMVFILRGQVEAPVNLEEHENAPGDDEEGDH